MRKSFFFNVFVFHVWTLISYIWPIYPQADFLPPPPRASLEFYWGYFTSYSWPPSPSPLPLPPSPVYISPVSATWGFFHPLPCWMISWLGSQPVCLFRTLVITECTEYQAFYPVGECCSSPPFGSKGGDTLACGGKGWGTLFRRWDRHSRTLMQVYHNFYVPASFIMYLSDFCRFLLCTCGWERRGERGGWRRGGARERGIECV